MAMFVYRVSSSLSSENPAWRSPWPWSSPVETLSHLRQELASSPAESLRIERHVNGHLPPGSSRESFLDLSSVSSDDVRKFLGLASSVSLPPLLRSTSQ